MNATAYRRPEFDVPPAMIWALVLSILFHIGVFIAGKVGMPFFRRDIVPLDQPIAIELVQVADKTTTNKPPVKAPPVKKKETPVEKKKEAPPMPPKVEAKEPPKSIPPKPPEVKEVAKKPEPKPTPPPAEQLKEVPKPPEPKKEEKAEDQQEQFDSVLKNLQDAEQQPETDVINPQAEAPPQPSPLAQFSQQLTMSETDRLRQQLSRCWSIQAGARYAEDLKVEIRLLVNPDRSVSSATVVDQWRYGQDGFFRAAADSAMRAVRSPMCNPLDLPPEKYQMWKDIIVLFDPSDML